MQEDTHQLQRKSYHIKNLYLDPNNYRFVDNDNYVEVPEEKITDDIIQKRTRGFIEGKKRENIRDLIDSFKANGFLDVDIIQVRDLGANKYLVLEGNRRVTALKALQEDYEAGLPIGQLDPKIFRSVPFEVHANEDRAKHTIIMGLKHISGNKTWPAINQAKLIYDYLQPYWDSDQYYAEEDNLCKSLGVSKQWLRYSQRAYHLILQYRRSDYSDQFESDMYSLFVEIIRRPTIKEWLDWDDYAYRATNAANLERLFSWISRVETENEEGERVEEDAIITKAGEVRDLGAFIGDEKALEEMETHRSLARGLAKSGVIEKESYKKSLTDLATSTTELERYKDLISLEDMQSIKEAHETLQALLPKQANISIAGDDYSVCFKAGETMHFSDVLVGRYKVFQDFRLENLGRINILAGFNNTGKTTLLEAIYLLTRQNEIGSLFEMIRLRNKLNTLNAHWLREYIDDHMYISGTFNGIPTEIAIEKYEASGIDKEDDYVKSYRLSSAIDGNALETTVHTFAQGGVRRFYEKIEVLCHSLFKSPYFYNHTEVIQTYTRNLEIKQDGAFALEKVIDFIKNIDPRIRDIRLGEKSEIERFFVDATNFADRAPDITLYGEGLQRIWEIALAFAYTKNGVILIDELETAIHKSLLIDFTRFLQELADVFNVQVFATSHSKECIDAFIENDYGLEDVSTYTLLQGEKGIEARHHTGAELKEMLELFDADLRGER